MSDKILDRVLTLELVRVTERAAVAASYLVGRGNEKDADQAAVDAMRKELNQLDIDGEVVIGEGERDEFKAFWYNTLKKLCEKYDKMDYFRKVIN